MTSSSSIGKCQGVEVSNVQFVRSDACPRPKSCAILEIMLKGDSMGAFFSIPPKVIMIHDVWSCYMCKIGEVGDYEIQEAYEKFCDEGEIQNY